VKVFRSPLEVIGRELVDLLPFVFSKGHGESRIVEVGLSNPVMPTTAVSAVESNVLATMLHVEVIATAGTNRVLVAPDVLSSGLLESSHLSLSLSFVGFFCPVAYVRISYFMKRFVSARLPVSVGWSRVRRFC
jgi:hypothetical protein